MRDVPLGILLTGIDVGRSPDLEDTPAGPGQWGVLKVSAVTNDGFRPNENKVVRSPSLYNPAFCVRQGDLLITRANTSALVGQSCVVGDTPPGLMLCDKTLRLRVNERLAPTRYLQLALVHPSVRRQIENAATGTSGSMKNISQQSIRRLMIPVGSMTEMQQIVEILDSADALMAVGKQRIAKLGAVQAGLLHSSIARVIDAADSDVDGWSWSTVRDTGTVQLGRQRSPEHQTGNYIAPYLRVANVMDGYIDYSNVLQMNFTPTERQVYDLRHGDILLNEGQDLRLTGRCAIYNGPDKMFFQNTLIRYRSNQLLPEFGRAVFKYWLDVGEFAKQSTQTTSVAHLSANRFARMPIPVAPKEEQLRIVGVLSEASQHVAKEQESVRKLRALKQGLMDDLLSGWVRVPAR